MDEIILKDYSSVKNRKSMCAAIRAAWADLPLTAAPGFSGINGLVKLWPKVLREVIQEGGYDTKYM